MSTVIRSEISKRNKYWISKHRYYELKHFCLQYQEWKSMMRDSYWVSGHSGGDPQWSDRVFGTVNRRENCSRYISMVEKAAQDASDEIGEYILKAVTEDLSYVNLRMIHEIPCGKDMYYDRYRKFFWLLAKAR